jgi:iron-sulfur cluster assembly protein
MNTAAMSTATEAALGRAEAVIAGERLELTEAASSHIRRELAKEDDAIGFRIAVRKTGCSGWMYVVEFVQEAGEDDLVFRFEDLDVYIDQRSFDFVRGMKVDFVSEGLSRHLKFINPNVTSECGCGESFSVG